MNIFNLFKKSNIKSIKEGSKAENKDSLMNDYFSPPQNDILKANIPGFLYKPPFGYPRKLNVPHIRDIAKTPYIFSIIKTLSDEAAGTDWSVRVKKEFANDPQVQKLAEEASLFLKNPNGNDESFQMIQKAVIKDLLELDSGVIVKVFNPKGKLSQLFARDSGSFLKNPDVYGYMGGRNDFIKPLDNNTMTAKEFGVNYSEAAYFQYGWTSGGHPIPFGKREIVYIMHTPRTDSIYGESPINILTNTLYMLIYGQQYNLDYYMNGNVSDGIIHLPGADAQTAKSFSTRLMAKFRKVDDLSNKVRVGHQYPVWGGEDKPNFIPFALSAKDMQILEQQKWFIQLVWSVFGVTPTEMGFIGETNRATADSQLEVHKRKAVQPLLETLQYHYTTQILTEFDPLGRLEFIFDDYDINTEMKKMTLYQKELDLGIKSARMIAEEEGINYDLIKLDSTDKDSDEKDEIGNKVKGDLKAFRYSVGDSVKIIKENPGYTGTIGKIEEIDTNKNNEYVYKLRFDDQTFISVFADEIRSIDKVKVKIENVEEIKPSVAVENTYGEILHNSKIKGFKYDAGDFVKVIKENPGHTGMVGKIESISLNKHKEYIYQIRFRDKSYIKVFSDEIKGMNPNSQVIQIYEEIEDNDVIEDIENESEVN